MLLRDSFNVSANCRLNVITANSRRQWQNNSRGCGFIRRGRNRVFIRSGTLVFESNSCRRILFVRRGKNSVSYLVQTIRAMLDWHKHVKPCGNMWGWGCMGDECEGTSSGRLGEGITESEIRIFGLSVLVGNCIVTDRHQYVTRLTFDVAPGCG